MNNRLVQKSKRLLSGIVATAIATSMLPTLPAVAETGEKYPYTLFAGSSAEGAITVNAGNFCINGNVATNGTIVSSGNMNVNGTKTENAGFDMIYIFLTKLIPNTFPATMLRSIPRIMFLTSLISILTLRPKYLARLN